VYAGAGASGHLLRLHEDRDLTRLLGAMQVSIGGEKDHLTTRVAYKLDLRGPAVGVQTTCSTSLVAVCVACAALATGQCDMALAGGVSIVLPQRTGYLYREGGILSPDGHCRAFDARAAGAVGGSGAALVVLRRLDDALAAGDHVHAVIRGHALNNDGAVKVGYTAPSVEGQARVIEQALRMARFEPASIGYVEAHGTGTPLGDPIEVAALTQAFRVGTDRLGFCGLGSMKTNVGHLDAAAGGAGLIKAALAVESGILPASLHFERPNPALELDRSPFFVVARTRDWPDGARPRRAGVSSFGIGGTNAHVVLEEAPEPPLQPPGGPAHLVALSARTEAALDRLTTRVAGHLRAHPELDAADVGFTLRAGRQELRHRRAVVCTDAAGAAAALTGETRAAVTGRTDSPPRVAFLFPGQGAQRAGMAAGLLAHCPAFGEELARCGSPELLAGSDVELRRTERAQPALFAVELALARLLRRWGVRPDAMVGHSVGEYVAACLAGVLSAEDAMRLVAARGRLMQRLPPGAMLAVTLPEADLRLLAADELAGGDLDVAAVNAPAACVLSGADRAVAAAEERLRQAGVPCRRLEVSHAFHSAMMDPVRDDFLAEVGRVTLRPPSAPYLSNLTGDWILAEQATDPEYWWRHLRSTVRFGDALRAAAGEGDALLVEVGPGHALCGLARMQAGRSHAWTAVPALGQPGRTASDVHGVLEAAARLWTAGAAIDLAAVQVGERRRRVPLPTYPFERRLHRITGPAPAARSAPAALPREQDERRWLFAPSWRRGTTPVATSPAGGWLLFGDRSGLGAAVANRLRAAGARVTEVAAGAGFAADGDRFTVDPGCEADYRRLLDHVPAFERAVHLWSLDGTAGSAGVDDFRGAATLGFHSARMLLQAILARGGRRRLALTLVSDRTQDVTGLEAVRPAHAALRALCTVVPQEHPHLRCRGVDVDLGSALSPRLAEQLVAELAGGSDEPFVAYRGPHRWTPAWDGLQAAAAGPGLLRERGTYLLTGGLGRIGRRLARHLAAGRRANLVLCGRSGGDGAVARELEAAGGAVLMAPADVSDLDAMRGVVAAARARFGRLDGAVHLAAATGAQARVVDTDAAACERQFAPKVHGALHLARVLDGLDLDFVLLFSSLSSILGGLGFLGYAAANSVLDSLAATWTRDQGTPWISVAWDGWQFAGTEVGASALGRLALSPEEGVRAFDAVLASRPPARVAVSTADLGARVRTWVTPAPQPSPQRAPAGAAAPARGRPDVSTRYEPPRGEVEEAVCHLLEALLGVEPVGRDDNFFELGGNSLLAIQLTARLRDRFAVDVSVQELFDSATLADFGDRVAGAMAGPGIGADELSRLLDEVEGLSDQEVRARLDGTVPSSPAAAPLGAGVTVREFYDRVSAQLDATELGPHALFLNFGYAGEDGDRQAVELPPNLVNRNSVRLVLETVAGCEVAGRRVLDVGCGRGGTVSTLRRYLDAGELVGVDLSPGAVRFCVRRHRGPGVMFLVGDAQRLPFGDGSFDVVTNVESSHSYPDVGAFFAEVRRVLRPGGVLCYTDLLPLDRLAGRLALARAAGLDVVLDRDITRQVVRSCDEVGELRRAAFVADDARLLGEFLGAPGSAVYEDLRTGRVTYRIVRFARRP
jgi:acyl transferase domain-containing protein/SAM-dependent methyltransferase